jgi:hypothetical protein
MDSTMLREVTRIEIDNLSTREEKGPPGWGEPFEVGSEITRNPQTRVYRGIGRPRKTLRGGKGTANAMAIPTTDIVECPKCGEKINLSVALSHRLDERVDDAVKQALAEQEAAFDERLCCELKRHDAEALKRAEARVAGEIADLGESLNEKNELLTAARQELLDLRKSKRALEDERESLDLEIARRVDGERVEITSQVTKRLSDEHQLTLREKDLQLGQMRRQIEDLKRASEQTRPGLKGEVLVREVEDLLRQKFPTDRIRLVKTGAKGADIVQTVRSPGGQDCGKILWESKRAKNWSNEWIAKLKTDQRAESAAVAVIVSTVLPPGVETLEAREGVWIVHTSCAVGIALALRERLIELAHARCVDQQRSTASDLVYRYISGPEFRDRFVTTAEPVVEMQSTLEAERRAFQRIWSKRERQIERMFVNLGGTYGDLQGIMGDSLAPVETFELPGMLDDLPLVTPLHGELSAAT